MQMTSQKYLQLTEFVLLILSLTRDIDSEKVKKVGKKKRKSKQNKLEAKQGNRERSIDRCRNRQKKRHLPTRLTFLTVRKVLINQSHRLVYKQLMKTCTCLRIF